MNRNRETGMADLAHLEYLILAALEEAGEENLVALANTVLTRRIGSSDELGKFQESLVSLFNSGLTQVSFGRDTDSLEWIPGSEEECTKFLGILPDVVRWSQTDQLWRWAGERPRPQILLTDKGMHVTRKWLSEHDWPRELQ
jgi:hypothetical protein